MDEKQGKKEWTINAPQNILFEAKMADTSFQIISFPILMKQVVQAILCAIKNDNKHSFPEIGISPKAFNNETIAQKDKQNLKEDDEEEDENIVELTWVMDKQTKKDLTCTITENKVILLLSEFPKGSNLLRIVCAAEISLHETEKIVSEVLGMLK